VWFEKLQNEYKLTSTCGLIPVALFYTAIVETSGKAAADSNSPSIARFFGHGTKTLEQRDVGGSTTVESIRSEG
jgi:hypothetical protein